MPKYLIEVPHDEDRAACLKVVHLFLTTGSHYLSNCDWGCMDGEHKAWITVDVDSKEDALNIVPPLFRAQARVVRLEKFSQEMVEAMLAGQTPDAANTDAVNTVPKINVSREG